MSANLSPKGLHTFANELEYPDGALSEAENIVIDKEGVAEPRRGYKQYGSTFGSSSDRVKQLLVYKNRIIRHYGTVLQYDNGSGTFTALTGSYSEPESGIRIKAVEANGNFFFTTSNGIKKIDALNASQLSANSVRDAGGIKGIDIEGVISYSQAGFFSTESKVVYRVVWGYVDNNNNTVYGYPSPRAEVVNRSATDTGIVKLTFTIPQTVQADVHFYQVYRSAIVGVTGFSSVDDISIDDELQLVIEDFPTTSQLTAGEVTLTDTTPDDFREAGLPLYTNVNSGEGIAQANERPPLAKDIAVFNGSTFYANTKTVHRKEIDLLSITGFTSGTSEFIVSNGTTTNNYRFVGVKEVTTVEMGGSGLAVPTDFYGKYFTLSSFDDKRSYYVWYSNGATTDPAPNADWIGVEVDISSGVANLTDLANKTATVCAANANLGYDFDISRVTTTVTFTATNAGKATNATAATSSFVVTTTVDGDGESAITTPRQVRLSQQLTPGQQIDDSARSIARMVNKNASSLVIASYISGANELPGQLLFESKAIDDQPIYFAVNDSNIASKFNPALPVTKSGTSSTGTTNVTINSTAHGLANGDKVVIYSSATTPSLNGVHTISGVSTNTFNLTITVPVTGGGSVSFFKGSEATDNEDSPNRVYFSKFQQPEAVPLLNYIDVGSKDKDIERIVSLRDSLFVFKTDGIYRIYGSQAPNFNVSLFDNSASIIAPDSACVLNNKVYALTTQGVSTVSESGVNIISRNIEDKFARLYSQTNTRTATFGLASETDRAFFLWTVKSAEDTTATTAYRFNVFTNAWTEWPIAKTCGVRNSGDDKIYLGPADINQIEVQRKAFSRFDYADREYDLAIPQLATNGGNTIKVSSITNVDIGDVITQTQYLTISQFNRFLERLDRDPGLDDNDYLELLQLNPGDNLFNKLNALIVKLDADDAGETYTVAATQDFPTLQAKFNEIIVKLNGGSSNAFYKTFSQSSGTLDVEGLIVGKRASENEVTMLFPTSFLEGNIKHYKAIQTKITWVPQHFGQPDALKQINEGTFMFKFNNFTSGTISYNSDIEQNFDEIEIGGAGPGAFGSQTFNSTTFGGLGNKVPVRTYVPRTKQRCRFLQCRFEHSNAFEQYQLYGLSLNPRVISTRSNR